MTKQHIKQTYQKTMTKPSDPAWNKPSNPYPPATCSSSHMLRWRASVLWPRCHPLHRSPVPTGKRRIDTTPCSAPCKLGFHLKKKWIWVGLLFPTSSFCFWGLWDHSHVWLGCEGNWMTHKSNQVPAPLLCYQIQPPLLSDINSSLREAFPSVRNLGLLCLLKSTVTPRLPKVCLKKYEKQTNNNTNKCKQLCLFPSYWTPPKQTTWTKNHS